MAAHLNDAVPTTSWRDGLPTTAWVPCPDCNGEGAHYERISYDEWETHTCQTCGGESLMRPWEVDLPLTGPAPDSCPVCGDDLDDGRCHFCKTHYR